jgi:hypothetical protein
VITLGAEIWNNVHLSISALVITISYTLIGIKILRQKVVGEGHLTSENEKRKTQRKHQVSWLALLFKILSGLNEVNLTF